MTRRELLKVTLGSAAAALAVGFAAESPSVTGGPVYLVMEFRDGWGQPFYQRYEASPELQNAWLRDEPEEL